MSPRSPRPASLLVAALLATSGTARAAEGDVAPLPTPPSPTDIVREQELGHPPPTTIPRAVPSAPEPVVRTDRAIRRDVRTALEREPTLHRAVRIDVHRGVVTLRGKVTSPEDRVRLENVARSVPGVTDVRTGAVRVPTSGSRTPAPPSANDPFAHPSSNDPFGGDARNPR
jgi:hypothetical protein